MADPVSAERAGGGGSTKIGLALSGGGFRASIFHLGVIRRLEELGIMKDVDVISTVSGGSIIGAYYVCEMEKRLRARRAELKGSGGAVDEVRLEIFEAITEDFFEAVRHNMRTRALIFAPFYHPLLFLKSLWPGCSRSDIIQREYDLFLFDGNTLDQLPSVTRDRGGRLDGHFSGPRLVINTTSLLRGERKSFSREPISGLKELKKVNTNVLPLARVVGASACVPGLFPPTPIAGDLLVDGGVSDNQGIDGLLKEGREDGQDYNLILVSDASGQMEQVNALSPRARTVLPRTMSVFQHEIRNKEIDKLLDWKRGHEKAHDEKPSRAFAFVHLFLNLKDRPDVGRHRVPSEYIPALARIRTDLDQFSMVEREALMYHGYTLVNSQLREHCAAFLDLRGLGKAGAPAMRIPPLFQEGTGGTDADANEARGKRDRDRLKKELEAGARPVFVMRSIIKYPRRAAWLLARTWLVCLAAIVLPGYFGLRALLDALFARFGADWFAGVFPEWMHWLFGWANGLLRSPVTIRGAAAVLSIAASLYLLAFATYWVMRRAVLQWDGEAYRRYTGDVASVRWAHGSDDRLRPQPTEPKATETPDSG